MFRFLFVVVVVLGFFCLCFCFLCSVSKIKHLCAWLSSLIVCKRKKTDEMFFNQMSLSTICHSIKDCADQVSFNQMSFDQLSLPIYHRLVLNAAYCSKTEMLFFFFLFFLLFHFRHQMLFGTVLQHNNARPHAAHYTKQFLTNNKIQIILWPSKSACFPAPQKTKQTWNEWTDAFKAEWTPLEMCVSCFRHSRRSGWPS